jgi:autotransporter-associated beta strand protein
MKMKTNMNFKTNCRPSRSLLAGRIVMWMILLLGGCLISQVRAQQPLPFYEPFPNTYGNNEEFGTSGSSGVIWTIGNSVSSSCARIMTTAAMSYPGLTNIDAIAQSYGLASYPKDTGSTKDRAAALVIPASTTLYASCVFNLVSNITAATYNTEAFWGLSPTASGSSVSHSGAVVFFNAAGQLMIAKNSTTPATNTTYALATNTTHLIVLRYRYTGSNDEVALWLDPTSLGNNSTVPPPTITTTNNANVTTFGSVGCFENALPTQYYLDEIRVATNWSGVTPTNAPPGNLYSVTGGGAGCAGASFNVGISGSDSTVTYLLYTNGVLTGESENGTGSAVSFGLQNVTALYTVLGTNQTSGNDGWMSGSATVSVTPAPNIAVQPVSALVATNGLAAFTVAANGNGFSYAWYRNGTALSDVNEFSGSQTTNLVISPCTTADAATVVNGYYVKVSNPCGGFIYSVTNALKLDAPANLIWSGDGISNLWDVAISTNWNYSNVLGYPTNVFNFGDNVTFDDTSGNTTVNLANPNLSPTSITVNGAGGQNYTFVNTGGGLTGSGSILMNSLGALNLNTPSSETGGITISNGTVYYYSPTALGYGLITLAGGGLAAPNAGLITVTNAITITGSNSVIAINAAGGQPLVLTSPLNGAGGSLVFSNGTTKTGTATIQLMAPFTFNLPVDLNIGTVSGGGLLASGNNTTGSQTWNNLITDAGGLQRNGAGGTTVLNNTNTYSGITRLTSGTLAVSVDSISIIAPPAVDAGPLGTGLLSLDTTAATNQLIALGGARVIGNAINYVNTNFGSPFIIGGTNNLTLSGAFDMIDTNRVIETDNTGITVLSGVITDDSTSSGDGLFYGITKTGNGALYLDGDNDFYGDSTNSAGMLAGSGIIWAPLWVQSGATIGAGDAAGSIGTLTINNNLTLNGNVLVRVNKLLSPALSNDTFSVSGVLTNTGAGTLTVSNLGPALAIGNQFTVFSEAVSNGAALTVTGGGANWTNYLAVNGSIQVLSLVSVTASYPTNMSFRVGGGILTIGWPATHLGWILQSQTNALTVGLTTPSNTWFDVSGSSTVTNEAININPAKPTVFYRLRHP